MTRNSNPNDSRGEIYVQTIDSHLIVSQDRQGKKRQVVSMTLEEAEDVVTQLKRRIRLEKELQRTGLGEV